MAIGQCAWLIAKRGNFYERRYGVSPCCDVYVCESCATPGLPAFAELVLFAAPKTLTMLPSGGTGHSSQVSDRTNVRLIVCVLLWLASAASPSYDPDAMTDQPQGTQTTKITITWDRDGSTTTFVYTFDTIPVSRVDVYVREDDEASFVLQIENTHYTHVPGSKQIIFESGSIPPDESTVLIERFTTRDRQIDYVGGSTLSESNLDNDALRLTYVDQEIEADIDDALKKDVTGQWWQCEGIRSHNAAPATTPSGWITKAQAEGILMGVEVAETDTFARHPFAGDGVTTDFELTNETQLTVTKVLVHVDRVYQKPDGVVYEILNEGDSGYPSGGTWDHISFGEAPADGAEIEVIVIEAIVLTKLDAGAIDDEDMIADDVINEDHINVGAGDDKRILISDTDGDMTARTAVHTDISDFDAGVRTNRLDQMAAPTAAVDVNSQKLTNVAAGTVSTDGVNKGQLDAAVFFSNFATGSLPDLTYGMSATKSLGFVPDEVAITGKVYTGLGSPEVYMTWTVVGMTTSPKSVCGGAVQDSGDKVMPDMSIRKHASDGFVYGNSRTFDGQGAAITDMTFRAIKY